MNNLDLNRKFQKNRFFRKPKKINLNFGDCVLISPKECRIELVHLTIMKYFLKNCLRKKKKSLQVNEKVWYFCRINFCLQKKSKNSRMGKGKGMIERQVIRIKKNQSIFEFKGFSDYRLKKFCLNVNKKTKFNFYLFFTNFTNYNLWCGNNKCIKYFDKYLLY